MWGAHNPMLMESRCGTAGGRGGYYGQAPRRTELKVDAVQSTLFSVPYF